MNRYGSIDIHSSTTICFHDFLCLIGWCVAFVEPVQEMKDDASLRTFHTNSTRQVSESDVPIEGSDATSISRVIEERKQKKQESFGGVGDPFGSEDEVPASGVSSLFDSPPEKTENKPVTKKHEFHFL